MPSVAEIVEDLLATRAQEEKSHPIPHDVRLRNAIGEFLFQAKLIDRLAGLRGTAQLGWQVELMCKSLKDLTK